MSEERANLFRNIRQVHNDATQTGQSPAQSPAYSETAVQLPKASAPRKRGRPANGKRSDPDWIGRTYYVKRATDLDVEGVLVQLKRRGIELDKSELVNSLLGAWVEWQQSTEASFPEAEVPPHRSLPLDAQGSASP